MVAGTREFAVAVHANLGGLGNVAPNKSEIQKCKSGDG